MLEDSTPERRREWVRQAAWSLLLALKEDRNVQARSNDLWRALESTEETQEDPAACPDCGGGWTFDFISKRVYCRTCESEGKSK